MSTEQQSTKAQEKIAQETAAQAAEQAPARAGDLLRAKREQLGLSQQEVAERLNLRVSIIESIDQNNLELDKVATFTRGYLRSYAKLVQVDEKIVLAALSGVDEAQHKTQKMQSFSRKTNQQKHDSRIMRISWIILVIIIGISSVWWYQNRQDTLVEREEGVESTQPEEGEAISLESSRLESPEAVSEQVAPSDSDPEEAVSESPEEQIPQASSPQLEVSSQPEQQDSSEAEVISEASQPVAEAVPEAVEPPVVEAEQPATEVVSPALQANNILVMSFASDCWIMVKDADGKTLSTGVKKAGQALELSGATPYSVVLGAPEGVTMTFASEPVDLSGYTAGKVARFTLP